MAPGGGGRDKLIGRSAVRQVLGLDAMFIVLLVLSAPFKLCRLQPYSFATRLLANKDAA